MIDLGSDFVKYPSTPHIQLSEWYAEGTHVILEEKVDGANLGISFSSSGDVILQNRGHLLTEPFRGQWVPLTPWLRITLNAIFDAITDRYIVFGEWCYAVHTVYYDLLPSWFIAFDIYDKKSEGFLSTKRRNSMLESMRIPVVPELSRGIFTATQLSELLNRKSQYSDTDMIEGLYLRKESELWLESRMKLVRNNFIQVDELHWRDKPLRFNQVKSV